MPSWLPPVLGTLDIAAFGALIIGIWWNARETRRATYINLETESLAIFRFEAEYRAVLAPVFNEPPGAPAVLDDEQAIVANNYFLQILNLFEIATRLRRRGNLDAEIFGSWVSWFFEVSEMGWFRRHWDEYRFHYSSDLRCIFDGYFADLPEADRLAAPETGSAAADRDYEARRRSFFAIAGLRMKCKTVTGWLDDRQPRSLSGRPRAA